MSSTVAARDVLAFRVALEDSAPVRIEDRVPQVAHVLGQLLQRYRLYAGYDLRALRRSGSSDSSERRLAPDGSNVFSVLRNWRDRRDDRHRHQFVLEGVREMFGGFFEDLDFSKAAQVVGAELILRSGKKISASLAPDGWYAALLHLTAVASTDNGDAIAIDEPENALHPHAIKLLLELMRDWSQRRSTTILLATHSPVIIDTFKERPEQLYVMEPSASSQPVALSELKDPQWLAHFLWETFTRAKSSALRWMVKRIGLITTGDCEHLGLVASLTRVFAGCEVSFESCFARPVESFTSSRLLHPAPFPKPAPTLLDKLVSSIAASIQRRDAPDFVFAIDDLELVNMATPEQVITLVREAVSSACEGGTHRE